MSRSDTNRNMKKFMGRESYDTRKVYAKSYLVINGSWKYTQAELSNEATATEKENNLKAWSEFNLLVDETIMSYILDTETAKQVWDSLQNVFEDIGSATKQPNKTDVKYFALSYNKKKNQFYEIIELWEIHLEAQFTLKSVN